MTKFELIAILKAETDLTEKKSIAVFELFFDERSAALAKGGRVEIWDLFSFFVKNYDAYTGRNPRTGEAVRVKTKKLPYFKPGL